MLVYASQSSSRLEYILEFISRELFDPPIQLTKDQQAFINYTGAKINYSDNQVSANEFRIDCNDLLFEKGIKNQTLNCFDLNGKKAFFASQVGDYPFDLFAASFYLLSRYEEYLPHTKDKYGRYAHTNSIAYKESFLHLPLINLWLKDFQQALLHKYPALTFRNKAFTFIPTYDIDIAWSYRNKGWWRSAGGLIRSMMKFDRFAFIERLEVLLQNKTDPFDSYEWLNNIHDLLKLNPVYFFLLAHRQQSYDKNISPLKKDLQDLIQQHALMYTTGIHPSWQSGDNNMLLEREIERLEQLAGHAVIHSRQHYLRFTVPVTFRKLIGLGIRNEYSMGYGSINGFRASVASTFFWYDLENDTSTKLLIHPFCFMDATAFYELKLSSAEAFSQLEDLCKSIKEVNGLMITLWHNNFLGTDRSFKGWREVYEKFLNQLPTIEN